MPVSTRRQAANELREAWDHTCFLAAATAPYECRTEQLAREVSGATITPYTTTPDWWLLTAGFLALRFVGFWCTDELFARGEFGEARQFADAVRAMFNDARASAPLYGMHASMVASVLEQLHYMLDVLVADARADVTVIARPFMTYGVLLRDIARDVAPPFRPAGVHALLPRLGIHVFQFAASVLDTERRPTTVRPLRRGIDRSQLAQLYMEWGATELTDSHDPVTATVLLAKAQRTARSVGNTTLAMSCAGLLTTARQQLDAIAENLEISSHDGRPFVAVRT